MHHKIHSCEVYNVMIISIFTELCNCRHNFILNNFQIVLKRNLVSFFHHCLVPLRSPKITKPSVYKLTVLSISYDGVTQ